MTRNKSGKPQSQFILYSLAEAKPTLAKLKKKGKPYDSLIDEIIAFPDDESDEPTPNSKELQARLGISSSKLRKWIDDLHEDFIHLIGHQVAMSFSKTQVRFVMNGSEGLASFRCELSLLPRIGDSVNFNFMYAATEQSSLYVESIWHHYENDEDRISVYLTRLSPYVLQLKQRAKFEKRFDQFDLMARTSLSSFEIEDLLYKWYGKG